jgi:two-component system sensor histidine kinase KdpD
MLVKHMEATFGREVVVLLPSDQAQAGLMVHTASTQLRLDPNELAVADWVYRHGQPAGRNTNTLPAANLRYLPLKTAHGVVGVLGIRGPALPDQHLTPKQRRLMEAFANQASLAIERAQLAEAARQAQVLQAAERLQTALLNSVSHDLRTPLVSITGALSSLEEDGALHDEASRRLLLSNARTEAARLNRLVGNLLQMTRLEAGALKLSPEPHEVHDLVGAALDQLEKPLHGRPLVVDVPDDLPLAPMDLVLMVQVLVNVLDNAIKYSPTDSPIELRARVTGAYVEIQVADRGVGIPPEDLTRVFDKFYRVERPGSVTGTGLGLSICKGIVEAHGGFIAAENRPGGGTLITVALPAQ